MKPSNKSKYPDKLGKKSFDNSQISVVKTITPFEDIIHLAGICNLNLEHRFSNRRAK